MFWGGSWPINARLCNKIIGLILLENNVNSITMISSTSTWNEWFPNGTQETKSHIAILINRNMKYTYPWSRNGNSFKNATSRFIGTKNSMNSLRFTNLCVIVDCPSDWLCIMTRNFQERNTEEKIAYVIHDWPEQQTAALNSFSKCTLFRYLLVLHFHTAIEHNFALLSVFK